MRRLSGDQCVRPSAINPLSASRDVLLAITGGNAETTEAVISLRGAAEPVAERGIFERLSPYEVELSFARTGLVTVVAEGISASGGRFVREAVIDLTERSSDGAPYRVVSWSQRFD